MAILDLSEYGLNSLPYISAIPRNGFILRDSSKPRFSHSNRIFTDQKPSPIKFLGGCFRERNWRIKVSVLISPMGEEERGESIKGVNGIEEDDSEFDPSAPLLFNLAGVRAVILKHCWVKDPWRSMSYVVRDVVLVFGLATVAASRLASVLGGSGDHVLGSICS